MSGYHALLAPSSFDRTVKCQRWVSLARGLPPEEDTEETLEGNAADWVAKQYAGGNEVKYGTPIPLPGGLRVDYDMIHGAKMWVDVLGYGAVSGVPIIVERIHPAAMWGEPDGWRWDPIAYNLRLPDYKYGFGVHDPFEHWQLIPYGVGIADTMNLPDDATAELIVVQPRAHHKSGPVRSWKLSIGQLRAYGDRAREIALRAVPLEDDPNAELPPAVVGEHCIHCPARHICSLYQYANTKLVEYTGHAEPITLSPEAVGAELAIVETAEKILTARKESLRAQAEAYLRQGKRVLNYGIESSTSRLTWNEGVTGEEILSLGALLGKDLAKPAGEINGRSSPVVTPTQAIKSGIDETVIFNYSSRSKVSKLVRDSTTEARRAFGVTNT